MTAFATHDEIHDAIFALLETGHAVVITLAPDAHMRVQINKACCNRMKADGVGIDIGSALADAIDNLNRQP